MLRMDILILNALLATSLTAVFSAAVPATAASKPTSLWQLPLRDASGRQFEVRCECSNPTCAYDDKTFHSYHEAFAYYSHGGSNSGGADWLAHGPTVTGPMVLLLSNAESRHPLDREALRFTNPNEPIFGNGLGTYVVPGGDGQPDILVTDQWESSNLTIYRLFMVRSGKLSAVTFVPLHLEPRMEYRWHSEPMKRISSNVYETWAYDNGGPSVPWYRERWRLDARSGRFVEVSSATFNTDQHIEGGTIWSPFRRQ